MILLKVHTLNSSHRLCMARHVSLCQLRSSNVNESMYINVYYASHGEEGSVALRTTSLVNVYILL